MGMETELKNFIKIWSIATICLLYCRYITWKLPKGIPRLLAILPVITLFTILPLGLNSFYLTGLASSSLVWLANFNLLLFAFDHGPLSPPTPNPFHFVCIACLPIKVKQSLKQAARDAQTNHSVARSALLAIKVALLAVLFRVYDVYGPRLPKNVILFLYGVHLYLQAELLFAVWALPARVLAGIEIEKQFDEPYLSTSLQDFWGRRWNLTVTGILRPTVYLPIRRVSQGLLGPKWSALAGVLGTFLISGLMHELIYYYLTRVPPTWEVTWFFVLHGVFVVLEVLVKTKVGVRSKWRLHPAVSGSLTMGVMVVTSVSLFWPQLVRNHLDEKAIGEYWMLLDFFRSLLPLR